MAHKRKNTPEKQSQSGDSDGGRKQLIFDKETAERADELAKDEMRSFNNLMARLVNKEWERRFSTAK